jgi:hypothetical protein
MTDIQHAAEKATTGTSALATIVKTVTVLATVAWAIAVFAFMAALGGSSGRGLGALGPLLVLIFATPPFVIFVLPALLFSFLGGESGAKAGACLLVAGVVVCGFVIGGPMLRAMF